MSFCRKWAFAQLLMGVKKDTILEQNRMRHYEAYMREHNLPDLLTAQRKMEVLHALAKVFVWLLVISQY